MSLGLLTSASFGWRRVIGIADQHVVCAAPCHWNWWGGRRVGGVAVVRVRVLAGKTALSFEAELVQNRHF